MVTKEEFQMRLTETINWYVSRDNQQEPKLALRSSLLDPQVTNEYGDIDLTTEEEWQPVVQQLVEKRAELLRTEGNYPSEPIKKLTEGRLMVYFPEANASDGASAGETDGFFDNENVPPWDTWVALMYDSDASSRSYHLLLLCYIAEPFVNLANAGIGVNPELCITWVDDPYILKNAPLLREIVSWISPAS